MVREQRLPHDVDNAALLLWALIGMSKIARGGTGVTGLKEVSVR